MVFSDQKGNVFIIALVIIPIIVLVGAGGYLLGTKNTLNLFKSSNSSSQINEDKVDTAESAEEVSPVEQSTKIVEKNTSTPANKSALPLGDNKVSKSAQKGYIYSCRTQSGGGGAFQIGPWIDQTNKTYDLTKKLMVDGKISWPNVKISVNVSGATRTLSGNGLPSHTTGVYPIQSNDDAYKYDRNPNSIKEQTLAINLPANPTFLSTPECVGGEVGIMLTGIPIFNGFDADSRDAVAYEIQDECGGHPEKSGQYHYHGVSNCINDLTRSAEHSSLLGYAFDGFGIYGTKGENGAEVSTADLDECHGHTHDITWDDKKTKMYHYHLTYDFPYSVGCFRAKKSVNGPLGGGTSGQKEINQPKMQPGGDGLVAPSGPPQNGMPPPLNGQMPPPR